jgi:hypothetical protein
VGGGRSIEALRRIRRDHHGERLTLHAFKTLVREQFFMLLLDRDAALGAIPNMLPNDLNQKRAAFAAMREVLSASEDVSGERANRLTRVCGLFGLDGKRVDVECRPFRPQSAGLVIRMGGSGSDRMSADTTQAQSGSKYDRLIAAARAAPPTPTAVVHPCDETSLRGAVDSASAGIIRPILVGRPPSRLR